ncbi:MAG: hypothetical protein R3B96_16875 [Pirellulaceae bacterium]
MIVVLTLTFFSMLFWSFFEQAGSSVNNFTDRNVDRVSEAQYVDGTQVGSVIALAPTQEQVGYERGSYLFDEQEFNLRTKASASDESATEAPSAEPSSDAPDLEHKMLWAVDEENVGMTVLRTPPKEDKKKKEEEASSEGSAEGDSSAPTDESTAEVSSETAPPEPTSSEPAATEPESPSEGC